MFSTRKVLRGSASNVVRLALSVLVGLLLPPFLVRHLSQTEYSAWVLILQLGTYVNLLDLGLQTVIARLVAEQHAKEDHKASHDLLSSAFSILSIAAIGGVVLSTFLVWRVPSFFSQMPDTLVSQVRLSLLAIGYSTAFLLPFNPFVAVFTGLQEYGFPTAISLFSRSLSAVALVTLTLLHHSLLHLALALAVINIVTAFSQFAGWRSYASSRLAFSFFVMSRGATRELLRSGGIMTVWTLAGLLISGLDMLIVGHFDYANTGFYAVGVTVTNLIPLLVAGLFAPLLPATAALQATSTPGAIGALTTRATRYCTLVLCVIALPLFVSAFPLLVLWVGRNYASRSVLFLQILLAGNFIRQLGYPYSLIAIATGKQHLATVAAIAEGAVNAAISVWLAQRIGALGVALGTLAGAFVSVVLHLAVSMRFTRSAIAVPRLTFLIEGLLRPLLCVVPLLLLIPFWNRTQMIPAKPFLLFLWVMATLGTLYLVGLTAGDRQMIRSRFVTFFSLSRGRDS